MKRPMMQVVESLRAGRFVIARVLAVLFCLSFSATAFAQAPSSREKQAIKQVQSNIKLAGENFKNKKYEASKRYFDKALKEFEKVSNEPRPELVELLQPEFSRLSKAHELLSAAGQKLDELKPFEGMTGAGGLVSFTKTVAPIIVAKCGNCHVSQSRGDFSSASFDALNKSTMIAYGLPDTSRLIEVIENGEMPKGGLKVEPDELKALKAWIKQGAKFDGTDAGQSLNTFVTTPARNRERAAVVKPKGNETVSFGLHVAPVLLENCAQCHINQNPRGNFSMADFRSLLRGGDGGGPISAGKSKDSQIIKRLRGVDAEVMPPSGKLDDKIIDMIATWIDEGAAYDGSDERLRTSTVAAKAKADSQSHEELMADRKSLAAKTWKLVMDGVESKELATKNFVVTGSTSESRLTDISKLCESLAPKVAKELKAATNAPFVKGNVSVFVFDKRYDFSEFGKMVENRDFPKEIKGHWGYTTIDAYATILMTRNQSAEDVRVSLAQQIAAIHVASLGADVPRWFSDGLGLYTAKRVFNRDEGLKTLDVDADAALAGMIKPDDFVQNKMPADKAALVSYLFVKKLRSQAGSFNKLIKGLGTGAPFDQTFQGVYGKTPAALITGVQESARKKRR